MRHSSKKKTEIWYDGMKFCPFTTKNRLKLENFGFKTYTTLVLCSPNHISH